jgi:surface protein
MRSGIIAASRVRKEPIPIRPFHFEVNTANVFSSGSASNQFRLPTSNAGTYDFIVDWGDGSSDHITVWNQAEIEHTYSSIGIYEVKCTGIFRNIDFSLATADKRKILRVLEWGCLSFTNVFSFSDCSNLTLLDVVDVLNTSGGTSLSAAFTLCTSITTINRLNEWDVSSITSFSSMFNDATLFVGDVSAWDVSSATRFGLMFFRCLNFNGDLSAWNTSSATSLSQMFGGCLAFNSDISAWDVSNVTSFSSLFSGAVAFDQDLGAWDVGKGTSFTNFMAGKTPSTFSAVNLDAIYNGWSSLPVLVSSRTITFGTAKYTAAGSAGKAILQGAPNNWTITDGGLVP